MTVATSVSIQLPSGWIELDPRAPDLISELERAIGVAPEAREAARTLLGPLALELNRTTAGSEVVLVGLFAQAIEIDGSAEPFVVTANVVLAVSPQVGSLEEVRATLEAASGRISPIDLPAGAGVLATAETEVSDPAWEGSAPARTRRYLVLVPGTDRMAALNFLTPNLDLADQFDEVFDAIATTLEFGYDDDPAAEPPGRQP